MIQEKVIHNTEAYQSKVVINKPDGHDMVNMAFFSNWGKSSNQEWVRNFELNLPIESAKQLSGFLNTI